jgi:hypothetical protein
LPCLRPVVTKCRHEVKKHTASSRQQYRAAHSPRCRR